MVIVMYLLLGLTVAMVHDNKKTFLITMFFYPLLPIAVFIFGFEKVYKKIGDLK